MTSFDLKVRRLRVGMRQFDLASKLNVSPQFLSCVELGKKKPPAGFTKRYLTAVDDYARRMRTAGLLSDHNGTDESDLSRPRMRKGARHE